MHAPNKTPSILNIFANTKISENCKVLFQNIKQQIFLSNHTLSKQIHSENNIFSSIFSQKTDGFYLFCCFF